MNTDISVITKAILATTSVPEEIVAMAYDLGVSHGKSAEAARRSALAPKRYEHTATVSAAEKISMTAKVRSQQEILWIDWLCQRYGRVAYEPKKFYTFVDGKRSNYTPDFRCTLDNGAIIWVETKRHGWLTERLEYWSSETKQARAMQRVVKDNKLTFFVCAGKPNDCLTWQVLGLDPPCPTDPVTLVKADLPIRSEILGGTVQYDINIKKIPKPA